MMSGGLGTEIVEVVRIGRMIERHGEHFIRRVYTSAEIDACYARRDYLQQFAMVWALKIATLRALQLGFARGVTWHDIETHWTNHGTPFVDLGGIIAEQHRRLGGATLLAAAAACRSMATATVWFSAAPGSP